MIMFSKIAPIAGPACKVWALGYFNRKDKSPVSVKYIFGLFIKRLDVFLNQGRSRYMIREFSKIESHVLQVAWERPQFWARSVILSRFPALPARICKKISKAEISLIF